MKRYLAILAVALTLGGGLSGCTTLQKLSDIAQIATTNIEQPVTRKMYRNVTNGLIIAVVSLNVYKGKCERAEIAATCVAVVERLQGYTRRAKPVLASLRVFVRKNDQVNARIAYNTVVQIVSDLRSEAAIAGVQ